MLENDDTVRSIGNGNTDKLSTFFSDSELPACSGPTSEIPAASDSLENDEAAANAISSGMESETANGEAEDGRSENDEAEVGGAEGGEGVVDLDNAEDEDDGSYESYEDEEEEPDRISEAVDPLTSNGNQLQSGPVNGNVQVEESAFGRKVRKRKKKMETRLLKEILNDVKMSSKRH